MRIACKKAAEMRWRNVIVLIGICLLDLLPCCAQSNTWTQKANYGGGAVRKTASFTIGDKGYFGTGYNGSYLTSFWEYNPATDTWSQKGNFEGVGRSAATGFAVNGKGYIGTGYDGSYKNDFWEYDPGTNLWVQVANFLGTPRSGSIAFTIGNIAYVGTGISSGFLDDFYAYDPLLNSWSTVASMPGGGRKSATAFAIGNKGYVGTGYNGNRLRDFWEYDQLTDFWTQKSDFGGVVREVSTGFALTGKGYIGTGSQGSGIFFNDFWEYNPTDDTWLQRADYGGSNMGYTRGMAIGNKGYIGVGYNGAFSSGFWEYNPVGLSILSETSTNIGCFGDSAGSITITAAGSDTIYYSIDGGLNFNNTSGIFLNLVAGSYDIVIMRSPWGSLSGSTIALTEPSELLAAAQTIDISCIGGDDGVAIGSGSGGTAPYSFLWNTSATTSSITGLSVGTYSVTVSDLNGCESVASTTINDGNPAPQLSEIIGDTLVAELEVRAYSVGLNPGSTYLWSVSGGNQIAGDTSNSIDVQWGFAGVGAITVYATNSKGCAGDTVALTVTINLDVGVNAVDNSKNIFQVYPNPSGGQMLIDFTDVAGEGILRIYNSIGMLILERPVAGGTIENLVLEDIVPGIYCFNAVFQGVYKVIQVVIE